MSEARIFESLIIINERIEGLLARLDYTAQDAANAQSDLYVFTSIMKSGKIKNINKEGKKVWEMFGDHVPHNRRELMKGSLKPCVETFLQIAEIPDLVCQVLKTVAETNLVLDLNINLTLTQQVLKMVSQTTSLFIIMYMHKHLHIIPEIYSRLLGQHDDELEVSLRPVSCFPDCQQILFRSLIIRSNNTAELWRHSPPFSSLISLSLPRYF